MLAESAESPKTSTEVPEFNAWWLSSVDLRYLMVAGTWDSWGPIRYAKKQGWFSGVSAESLQCKVLALGLRTQWDFFFKKQSQGRSFCVWLSLIGVDVSVHWGTFWDVSLIYAELIMDLSCPLQLLKSKRLCPLPSMATVTFLEDYHQDLRICRSDHNFT